MTDKIKELLDHTFVTAGWRLLIMIIIGMSIWTWNRQITRIDSHDQQINKLQQFISSEFVKKDEMCELKADVRTIKTNITDIKFFMGRVTEFMDSQKTISNNDYRNQNNTIR